EDFVGQLADDQQIGRVGLLLTGQVLRQLGLLGGARRFGRLVIGGLIRITRSCGVFLVCGRLVGRGLRGRSSFGPASLDPVGEQAHRGGDGETDRDPGEQCLAGDQRRDQRAQRRQDQDQDEKQHDELHHETVGGYRDGGGVARTPSPSLKPYERGRYPRG